MLRVFLFCFCGAPLGWVVDCRRPGNQLVQTSQCTFLLLARQQQQQKERRCAPAPAVWGALCTAITRSSVTSTLENWEEKGEGNNKKRRRKREKKNEITQQQVFFTSLCPSAAVADVVYHIQSYLYTHTPLANALLLLLSDSVIPRLMPVSGSTWYKKLFFIFFFLTDSSGILLFFH